MTTLKSPLLILLLLLTFFSQSLAENCLSDTFSDSRVFSSCNSLSRLSAAVHWNYHPSNGTIDIAYRASQSSTGWVAWALNPTSHGMIGAQAFFAFTGSNSSMVVYLTGISSYAPVVQDGNLNFTVYSKEAEYSNGYMTIYATLELPGNSTTVNQVWEAGTSFSNGVPSGHALTGDNILSYGSIDFLSGATSSSGSSRQHRKNVSIF